MRSFHYHPLCSTATLACLEWCHARLRHQTNTVTDLPRVAVGHTVTDLPRVAVGHERSVTVFVDDTDERE
jgi:hypothetical protein